MKNYKELDQGGGEISLSVVNEFVINHCRELSSLLKIISIKSLIKMTKCIIVGLGYFGKIIKCG